MEFALAVRVENEPGVLARVASLVSRRGFNIESLAVGPTEDASVSRITLVCKGDERDRERLRRQLEKLVEVLEAWHVPGESSVRRELALVRVRADPGRRAELLQVAGIFRSRVVHVDRSALVLETTGDPEKIQAWLEVLRDFGIEEVARTGIVALDRERRAVPQAEFESREEAAF
ncbi:MAG: acetolactate synthase small subunit [Bacillota bacterium]|nr:acetolactate synthase small subunit [Bacillota bacterium]